MSGRVFVPPQVEVAMIRFRVVPRGMMFALAVALLLGCGGKAALPESNGQAEPEREVLYWYDPMRPEVHFDKPGRSPYMDMELVPMYADQGADATPGVRVPAVLTRNLGVRIGPIVRDSVRPRLRVPAQVRTDQDSRWVLVSRAAGWIERLNVHEVGDPVRAGEVVAEIYSPELVQAQEELLLSPATAPAAAERLRRLGIAEADIQAVREAGRSRRRLPLRAPVAGTLASIQVHQGARVAAESRLLEIVARHSVWVEARLFPGQAQALGEPIQAQFRLPGRTDAAWQAEQGYLYPVVDPVSQTQGLRFVLAESSFTLPPGLWLEAELSGAARPDVLLAPAEAVILRGGEASVVRALPDNRFVPTPVRIGARFGERIEVLEGVSEGDQVVVSGQFLLDSEADLRTGLNRLQAAPAHGEHAAPAAPAKERGHAD